jgi:hypothetical protein
MSERETIVIDPAGTNLASEAEGSVESGGADRPVLELRAVDSIRLGERIPAR